jgi:hypothetical protein
MSMLGFGSGNPIQYEVFEKRVVISEFILTETLEDMGYKKIVRLSAFVWCQILVVFLYCQSKNILRQFCFIFIFILLSQEQSGKLDFVFQKCANGLVKNVDKELQIVTKNDMKMLKELVQKGLGKGYVASMMNVEKFDTAKLSKRGIDTSVINNLWQNPLCRGLFEWKGDNFLNYVLNAKRRMCDIVDKK